MPKIRRNIQNIHLDNDIEIRVNDIAEVLADKFQVDIDIEEIVNEGKPPSFNLKIFKNFENGLLR